MKPHDYQRMNTTNTTRSITTWKLLKKGISNIFQIPYNQVPRVLYHGLLLSCNVAGFWLLDSLKDPVLSNTVGIEYQPLAKLLSVGMMLFVVCIYDFLTSLVSKKMLFHIVSWVYFIAMMVLSVSLSDPETGLSNLSLGPHRTLGWITYCIIESYGSLSVALFWSFTNSLMNLEEAKGAYGLIIAIAQIGAILGSTLASYANVLTIPGLFILGSVFILSNSLMIKLYHILFQDYNTELMSTKVRSISESSVEPFLPSVETEANRKPPPAPSSSSSTNEITYYEKGLSSLQYLWNGFLTIFSGFYEGLYLIIQYPYVLKLLFVSCLYDIVVTILDYEFKITGAKHTMHPNLISEDVANSGHVTDEFANLLGHFGQLTNFTSFLMSLFGFTYLLHKIGVQNSLLIFPFVLLIAVIVISFVPKIWVLFVFVSTLKALVFSLHDPAKELLYIPTSEGIKYKAKAWIDVFGSRFAKAIASTITFLCFGNVNLLRKYSEIPLLIVTGIVIYLTWSIGNDFQILVDTKKIVGEDETGLDGGMRPPHPHHPHHKQQHQQDGPVINGLKPGDVGYSGYDLELFEGVFEDDEFNYNIEMLQDSSYPSFEYHHKNPMKKQQQQQQQIQALRPPSVHSPHTMHSLEYFGKTTEELFEVPLTSNPLNNSNSSNNSSSNRSRTKSSHL